jgi:hypothetical protein
MTRKYGIDVDEYDDEVYNVAKDLVEQEELVAFAKLVNNDPLEYIVKIIKRTVKGEDIGIRIVLYSGLSCYTFNPLSVAVRAPTSEGKTYLVIVVISLFPKEDVWLIGSMSPKVLIRQYGTLVDRNNQPIADDVRRLKKEIKICEVQSKNDESKTERVEELKDELEKLLRESKYLIDLHSKILVFLEPPHPEVWNILKPIISHDHWEMEHPYVDTDLKTKNVVTRGWPVCIFCSARDESKWDVWPEIQSRFIIISPNMSKQKYAEANVLTFEKLGLPDFVQDQIIVSNKEMEIARKCILLLRKRIRRLCALPDVFEGHDYKPNNPVWIPYYEYLAKSLPATRGTDMRSAKYVGSLLSVIAIAKSNFLLDDGIGNIVAIARSEDLIETLRITQNLVSGDYSGMPDHKIKFLEEIFLRAYNDKEGPDEKDGKVEVLKALTSRELSDNYKKVTGKGISPDNLKKQFLDELKTNDLIGEMKSEIDGRRLLFYPLTSPVPREEREKITKLSNGDLFDNISYTPTLKLSRDYKYIPENWLILQILSLAKYRIDFDRALGPFADYLNQSEDLKFLERDILANGDDCTRLTIRDFILKYESLSSISIRYIFKADFYGFCGKNIGSMTEICLLARARYKIFSNDGSFDNFTISDGSDARARCETVLSKTQAAYHSDQGHGQISISKPALMPNQLKDTIRNLQSQTVSQIRGHLETLTTGTLNEYLDLLQEIYQPNGPIGHLIQEELQTRGLGNGCIF